MKNLAILRLSVGCEVKQKLAVAVSAWLFGRASILVVVLFFFLLPTGCSPISSATAGEQEPLSVLAGQPNFRDLGGYETTDGRSVRRGLLFRSGELPKLTDDDVAILAELGVHTVIDFRAPSEVEARGADRLPEGANGIALTIELGDLLEEANRARVTGDFSAIPDDILAAAHVAILHAATDQLAELLRHAADADHRPLVYHCSHGNHRTGVTSAILLSALGVPWETIREDYLKSNETRKQYVQQRLAEFRERLARDQGIEPEQVDMTNVEAFYILNAEHLDAVYDDIVEEHSSMANYIREELGISDEQIEQLRNALLE